MSQTCDILIVGGGVIGTSIAHSLARRKVGKIVLLEKSFLGAGSSGKSGAIIRQHYSNVLTASMAQKSLRIFERFDDLVGGPPVFTHTGMVIVVPHGGGPTREAIQRIKGIRERWIDYWSTTTGHRSTMTASPR